jgi:4-amino-4-deoxy-L-arabinose transferase-like glycosyltransferase
VAVLSRRRYVLILAAIAVAALAARLWALGADPPRVSDSNGDIVDGTWYFAEAADRARGREPEVQPHYRMPVVTAIMRVAFFGGVSLERAHAASAALGAALVLLAAGAARTAFGRGASLLAAFFLAVGYVPIAYGRTFVVYAPLAVGLAGSLWLFAASARAESFVRRALFTILAWAVLGALVLGVQFTAIVATPALAVGHVFAARRRLRAALFSAGLAAAVLAAVLFVRPALFDLAIGKARGYFGSSDPIEVVKRWLRAPARSGLFPKAPLVFFLAWAGVLYAFGRGREASRGERAMEAALATAFFLWVAVFGLFEFTEFGPRPPLRYFFPALVPGAILAARVLERASAPGGGLWLSAPRPAIGLWAALGCYWAMGSILEVALPLLLPDEVPPLVRVLVSFGALAPTAIVFGVAAALFWARPLAAEPLRIGARGLAVALALGLLADAARAVPMLASPEWTLRDANRAVAAILGENARAYGPWAHALTYEAPRVRRQLPPVAIGEFVEGAKGATHLFIDVAWMREVGRLFSERGVSLVPIARIEVRRHPIAIYRFPWAERLGYRPTATERALEARGQKER